MNIEEEVQVIIDGRGRRGERRTRERKHEDSRDNSTIEICEIATPETSNRHINLVSQDQSCCSEEMKPVQSASQIVENAK
jgi:hypothetical protein